MDSVKLMNRIDSKFVLPVTRLTTLLHDISNEYKVLEINLKREFNYSTVYLDTSDYLFYNQHLTGKMGRYKVRVRTYEANNLTYLEVKYKSNKGRTSKTRIRKKGTLTIGDAESQKFLRQSIGAEIDSLSPVITSLFTRITLVNLSSSERVTVDYNVAYSNNDGKRIDLPYLAIVEIKRNKSTGLSPVSKNLKEIMIRQTGFSKYCIGVSLINNITRSNSFKPKLLMLNKIKDECIKHDVATGQY